MASPLKLGIAGLGTVGASVVRLIERQRDALAARCGRPIEVVAVSARSRSKKRDIGRKSPRWVADPSTPAAHRDQLTPSPRERVEDAFQESQPFVFSLLATSRCQSVTRVEIESLIALHWYMTDRFRV